MADEFRKKLVFIVNPKSGSGKATSVVKWIYKLVPGKIFDFEIQYSSFRGECSEFAKLAVQSGCDAIIAVGGDGTVNEVGKMLIGTEIPLGIIPVGSGNGLARHMRIPLNPKKAILTALQMEVKRIDTCRLNNLPFLNVAGIGLDAQVSMKFSGSERRGWWNYLRIILELITNLPEMELSLKYNGKKEETIKACLLAAANSSQYGNNARIAPNADIQDGKMDICILKKINLFGAMRFFLALMLGKVSSGSHFTTFKTEALEITGSPIWAHVDGEFVETESTIIFRVVSDSLNIICRP